jgi:hypothetical protein
MMTLNRYLLVGKDHSERLVTIAKLEFKWVIRGSLIFSALFNIGHGWEYIISKTRIFDEQNDFLISVNYKTINGYSYSDYPEFNQGTPYFVYSIVYFCINFGVFFILNTVIEVKIVRRMQKELKEKRERLAKMNSSKPAVSTSCSGDSENHQSQVVVEDKEREKEDKVKERKVIKMVVLNGILNYILRAPDMFFWLENVRSFSVLFNFNLGLITDTPG